MWTSALHPRAGEIGGGLGHQVEVEELDELEFYLSRCCALLEKGCHCEQTVELFKGACVGRVVQQGRHEGEEGCRLDRGAINRIEEVKQ